MQLIVTKIQNLIIIALFATRCGFKIHAFNVALPSHHNELHIRVLTSTQTELHRFIRRPRSTRIAYISKGLYLSSATDESRSSGFSSNEDNLSINDIYKLAMEEDQDWYKNFIQNIDETEFRSYDNDSFITVNNEPKELLSSDVGGEREPSSSSLKDGDEEHSEDSSHIPENEDLIVQYRDIFGELRRVSVHELHELGYKLSDISTLKSDVLDLILEDGMTIPPDGVPKRWMVDLHTNREVKILRRKKKKRMTYREENNSQVPTNRSGFQGNVDSFGEETRSSYTNHYRPRSFNRNDPVSDEGSFWMDVPTFKKFLRQEAKLRLMILGPTWSEWVRNESDWRLTLYRNWVDIMKNGIGEEDVFSDISYSPTSNQHPNISMRNGRMKKRERRRSIRRRNDSKLNDFMDDYSSQRTSVRLEDMNE